MKKEFAILYIYLVRCFHQPSNIQRTIEQCSNNLARYIGITQKKYFRKYSGSLPPCFVFNGLKKNSYIGGSLLFIKFLGTKTEFFDVVWFIDWIYPVNIFTSLSGYQMVFRWGFFVFIITYKNEKIIIFVSLWLWN